ncbi:unnamed protein product [Arctia plantaginis]|uniref:Uncharacterized protein n=1 Tax=Arctia plantaginis TaxID=874455 RepID=A0A8S0Z336_ARCPL|nr:unnamed protein product [Arctia plantaginis]CAB3254798.1 unnamed protein product [Arctia plantaginis]
MFVYIFLTSKQVQTDRSSSGIIKTQKLIEVKNRIPNEGSKIKSASIFSRFNNVYVHLVSSSDKPRALPLYSFAACVSACSRRTLTNPPRDNLIELLVISPH